MLDNDKSIFDYKVSPIYLAIGTLILFLICIIMYHIFSATFLIDRDAKIYWILSGSFTLFYSMFCSVLLMPQEEYVKYYGLSVIGFLMVTAVSGITAYLFSGMGMDEAGTFRWLYVLFTICFLILLGIARFIKRMVKWTQEHKNL